MNRPPMKATEPMKQGIGDTAHISPPDIAISLPYISPRGHTRTIDTCKGIEPPPLEATEPMKQG